MPALPQVCPEIHGYGLEQHDDGDSDEQGIDDAGEVKGTPVGKMSWEIRTAES